MPCLCPTPSRKLILRRGLHGWWSRRPIIFCRAIPILTS
ncbi:DUF1156 domain-containing protein [Anaerovibrio slackiae]